MDAKTIISRLKNTSYKHSEAVTIKKELRQLPSWERTSVLNKLREEKTRSDNSDVIDVINDIINDFSPEK
ncbi:hypothetical protein ML462_15380 [Gramella lutea]|uniref:Uncharacterized protein n=1 Tax=Christiangramia lutea TaxID=1607951 RepID=A0A9X1V5E0_9FLAO|nr:hypothetical protein [Christiangramia lutea]MCH4824554.1 hypothetical protein [Christiangramia lutea]